MANKFRKNDQIIVIAGSNKGKTGKIKSVKGDFVVVDGVNIAIQHKKPTSSSQGQIIKIEKPLHISNISHFEGSGPVKIKYVVDAGEKKNFIKKYRVSKKTGKKI